jgi:hypothetical protein
VHILVAQFIETGDEVSELRSDNLRISVRVDETEAGGSTSKQIASLSMSLTSFMTEKRLQSLATDESIED